MPKGAGLRIVFWPIETLYRISLRIETLDVPSQDIITRDNVSVKVNAVAYFRVVDANLALSQVQNYLYATSQKAQTTLRSIVGQFELDEILAEREKVNSKLQIILDQDTEPWGIKVTKVEVKQVDIPEQMQRAIGRQAEAERERRAKVIHAEGEAQASAKLAEAAQVLETQPAAIQLRYLQTLTEIGVEKNTTIVFPLPIDIINEWVKAIGSEKVDGLKREKKRRRFCAGEQAPGRAVPAARGDFRRRLHARLSARAQPVRFQAARRGRQAAGSRPAGCRGSSRNRKPSRKAKTRRLRKQIPIGISIIPPIRRRPKIICSRRRRRLLRRSPLRQSLLLLRRSLRSRRNRPRRLNAPLIPKGAIMLQVAAVQQRRMTRWPLRRPCSRKNSPRLSSPPGADKYYRVQVGPYADNQSAANARQDLEAKGFKSIVKR